MALFNGLPWPAWVSVYHVVFVSVVVTAACFIFKALRPSTIPLVNPRRPLEFTDSRAKQDFMGNAREIVRDGLKRNSDKPISVITDCGPMIVLPNKFANEIRNHRDLSFMASTNKHFHTYLSTFESFAPSGHGSQMTKSVVQKQLTQRLANVTQPLSDECGMAVKDVMTDSPEWHELPLADSILRVVARLSSRVFLGDELAHNDEWLRITAGHTVTVFGAVIEMRLWPRILRPLVHWILPSCREARSQIREARRIIEPVLQRRREARQKLDLEKSRDGDADLKKMKVFDDGLEWFEQAAKGRPYDPAIVQLNLSIAAMHTTTDLLSQVLVDIASHPEIIGPLREEIIGVVKEGGWKKTSLYNMKLVDSVLKETQRIKPIEMATMKRIATKDVTLSDGSVIPKDRDVIVFSSHLWDEQVYQDPLKWDPYRFYRMREDANEQHAAQLVSTSPDHLGFGHGQHACPGRFFAANEIEVALCHLLLKYDWKLPSDERAKADNEYVFGGFFMNVNPKARLVLRRRKDEMEL